MTLRLLLRCRDRVQTAAFYAALPGFSSSAAAQDPLLVEGHGCMLLFTEQDVLKMEPAFSGTLYIAVADVDAMWEQVKGATAI